jgi:predicted SnoaL-like aldol condensation-catalyzing enzyme
MMMMMMMMMTTTATDKQTGKRVTLKTADDLFRIENGMIVEHWDVIDASGMA